MADGALVGPELLRHGFADHDDGGTVGRIRIRDIAALEHRNMHGFHVSGSEYANRDFRLFGERKHRMSFDGDGLVRTALNWQIVDGASGLHSGKRAHAFQGVSEERSFLFE